jgi:peptide/nickel transport system ATP-binding protein/oligopeptide transport system ATP-binding protein
MTTPPPILSVRGLATSFATSGGIVRAVDGVSFDVGPGEAFGLVGESGCGKSATCRSIIGLLPDHATTSGTVEFDGQNLLAATPETMRRVRGAQIAMVFQDPMTALNPVVRIGDQVAEAVRAHQRVGRRAARARALELLRLVGIPAPERRLDDYPHRFSGGMRQRVVIAIALAGEPRILLADEPTTALDVTIQDQILTLIVRLQAELGMSVVLVSHDLGVVARVCQRVAVMYAGQIAEQGPVETVLGAPRHPYTIGLLASLPGIAQRHRYLRPIPGAPPSLLDPPSGCRFHPRCPFATDRCATWAVERLPVGPDHDAACWRQEAIGEESRLAAVGTT